MFHQQLSPGVQHRWKLIWVNQTSVLTCHDQDCGYRYDYGFDVGDPWNRENKNNKNKSQWPRHNITDYWILSQNANKMKDHVTKAFYTLTNGLPTAKPVLSQTNSWKMILLVSAFTATAISMSPINRTIYWLLLLTYRIMHNRGRFSLTTLVTTPTGGCFTAPMSTAFYRCFP